MSPSVVHQNHTAVGNVDTDRATVLRRVSDAFAEISTQIPIDEESPWTIHVRGSNVDQDIPHTDVVM